MAHYFFTPHVVERLEGILDGKHPGKNVIPFQEQFVALLLGSPTISREYWTAIELIESEIAPWDIYFNGKAHLKFDIFEVIAHFIRETIGLPYGDEIAKMSELIVNDEIGYYDLCGQLSPQPFLQFISLNSSPESKEFHREMGALFRSRVISPDTEDLQRLKDEYAGKKDAKCYGCGDLVSRCDCPWVMTDGTEIPKNQLKGKRRQREFESLIGEMASKLAVQTNYAYWHNEIKGSQSSQQIVQKLEAFWDGVRQLIIKYQKIC
jgi:hypothetical protein